MPSPNAAAQDECDRRQRAIERMNEALEAYSNGALDDAVAKTELALDLDPENDEIAYNLGKLHLIKIRVGFGTLTDEECQQTPACTREWEQAAQAFAAAARIDPQEAMYFYPLGEVYYRAGNNQAALAALQEAVRLNNKLFRAHWYIGRIHMAMDQPKDAAAAWTEACRLNPSFSMPFIDLGRLYMKWDHYAEAATVLEQGALYAEADEPEQRTNVFYALGMAYDALAASSTPPDAAMYDKAIAAYQNALKASPANNDARFQLGFTYANQGDKANARKYLEEFIKNAGANDATAAMVYLANARLLRLVTK